MTWSRSPEATRNPQPTPLAASTAGQAQGIPADTELCSRIGVLTDCELVQSLTWCSKHDRSSCRCRRIASARERTSVLRDVASELREQGALFSATAVLTGAREIDSLVEADERSMTERIAVSRERREQAKRDEDTEAAWEMLRDAIGIPQDDAHGSYLADMVAEHVAQMGAELRATIADRDRILAQLASTKEERDQHLGRLLRASVEVARG